MNRMKLLLKLFVLVSCLSVSFPIQASMKDSTRILSDARSVDAAISIMQGEVRKHPVVLRIRRTTPNDSSINGSVYTVRKSYKGELPIECIIFFQSPPTSDESFSHEAYVIAEGYEKHENGNYKLLNYFYIPISSHGNLLLTATRLALVWEKLSSLEGEQQLDTGHSTLFALDPQNP